MSSSMRLTVQSKSCVKCGQPLDGLAPSGLCSRCLLVTGLDRTHDAAGWGDGAGAEESARMPPSFGDYELLEEIARGGMGVVYKARQVSLQRLVAIKMILAGAAASREFIHRFRTEAAAAANLQHPNIVAVHEVGAHQGENFLVMDFVDGPNLAHFVGQQPLPAQRAARYVQLIADAIHYAHECGILHRDLKPSNVLIDSVSDQPRVTDFGLAKRFQENSELRTSNSELDLTLTGHVLGSPNFMAPEQAAGAKGKASQRTDVYGLGAILYHLLTARPPIQAESLPETLQQVAGADPLPPRLLNSSIPRDLETICLKCLEKEPSRRYASARELAGELGRFLADEPIHARPTSTVEKGWRWCRRRPAVASFAGTTALLLLAVAIGAPIAAYRINLAREQALKNAAELRRNLYIADLNVASRTLLERQTGHAKELVDRYLFPAPDEEDLREVTWRHLWRQCQPNYSASLDVQTGEVKCAVFSSDGAWVATAGWDRIVRLWEVASERCFQRLGGFDDFIDLKALAFSPDNKFLVAKGGRRLRCWRTDTWAEIAPPLEGESNWNLNNAVVFSPDGRTVATRVAGGVGFIDTVTWQTNELFLNDVHRRQNAWSLGTAMSYSSDGRFLAVSDWHEIQVRDVHNPLTIITNLIRPDADPEMRVLSIAISPRHLAAGYRDGKLVLWNRETWREAAVIRDQTSFLAALAFSPDGQMLAAGGLNHVINLWQVDTLIANAERHLPLRPALTLRGHSQRISAVEFSSDGRALVSASGDGTAKVWQLSTQADSSVLRETQRPIWFSSDGTRLIALHRDGQLHQWDSRLRRDLGRVGPAIPSSELVPRVPPRAAAVSPDGACLALGRRSGQVTLWDLRTRALIREQPLGTAEIRHLKFAPNSAQGLLVIVTGANPHWQYWLWNSDLSEEPRVLESEIGREGWRPIQNFAISHDGKHLALAETSAKGNRIRLLHLERRTSRYFDTGREQEQSLAFSPDGHLLAAGDARGRSVRFWEISSGRPQEELLIYGEGMPVIEFSPDGKTLVTCDWDGVVRFWSVASRKQLMAVPNYNPMHYFLLFSADGSALALPGPRPLGTEGQVEVWTIPTLAEIDALENAKRWHAMKRNSLPPVSSAWGRGTP